MLIYETKNQGDIYVMKLGIVGLCADFTRFHVSPPMPIKPYNTRKSLISRSASPSQISP